MLKLARKWKLIAAATGIFSLLAGAAPAFAQLDCSSGQDFYGQGIQLTQAGNYDAAYDAFSCTLIIDGQRYDALLGRMEAELLAGDFGQAANDANRLKDRSPETFNNALSQYTAAISQNPNNLTARMSHLLLLWAAADDHAVIQAAEQLIAIDPHNALAYLMRGSSNQYLGDRITPAADFQMALNVGGENPDVYSIIGSTYAQTQDINNAYMALDRALLLDPNHARSYYFRGLTYMNDNNLNAAVRDFSTAIAFDPTYYDAFFDRGQAYALQNNYDAAVQDFSAALAQFPNFKLAYIRRGVVQEWDGNIADALGDYVQYIQLNTRQFLPPQVAQNGSSEVNLQPYATAQLQITLNAGQTLSVTTASSGVDAMIVVIAPDGATPLAGSDDPAPGQRTPVIQGWQAPAQGVYTLYVTSSDPGRANQGLVDIQITIA